MDNETTKFYMFIEVCVVDSSLWTTSPLYIQSQPGNTLRAQCDCASVHLIVVLYAIRSSNQYQPGTSLFLHFGCLRVSIVYAHIVRRALLESEKKAIDAVLRSSTSLITEGPLKILHKCLIRFGNL